MSETLTKPLTELFERVGPAHHQAFLATDGADPDWPLWYADFLHDDVRRLLDGSFTKTRLVRCLLAAAAEHTARGEGQPWPAFYAAHFAERFAPAQDQTTDQLALYYFPACPFCQRVLRVIDKLGLSVDNRDIRVDSSHFDALVQARSRATVPVLLITASDGSQRWMPESSDIAAYLEKTYG